MARHGRRRKLRRMRPMIRFRSYSQDTMGVYNPYRRRWRKR